MKVMTDHERMNYWWKRAKAAEEQVKTLQKEIQALTEDKE